MGIIEEEYSWQLIDTMWRRRRSTRWEAVAIQSKVSRETSVTKKEGSTRSAALLTLLGCTVESSPPEPPESLTTGPSDGGSSTR